MSTSAAGSFTERLRALGRPDVLILGAGQAGLCAALAAAEDGASVLILEKMEYPGGSTSMSSGLTAYAGTDEQHELGIVDSVESLKADILATGMGRCDESLVDVYCREQLTTYHWLRDHGVEYGHIHAASGQSVARSHATDPSRMIDTLLARAIDAGVQIEYGVRAFQLLVDDDAVVGVLCEVNGALHSIDAGAVVIATGGFSRNPELLERFVPHMRHAIRGGAPGSEGDGLLMAWKIGADFRDTPYVKGTFGIYPGDDPREGGTGILAVYKGAIAVNASGRRFVNESLPYKVLGDVCLEQEGHVAWQIFDQQTMAKDDPDVHIYWFSGRLATGLLHQANSLDELASMIGVPADQLMATVERYNAAVRGEQPDEFGRTTLSGTGEKPTEIRQAPYFAHLSGASVLATYCGLTIDAETHVLDVYGAPIPGLYAAGEVTGGFHGAGYVTGTSVGKSGIFGRLAGIAAAHHAKAGAHV